MSLIYTNGLIDVFGKPIADNTVNKIDLASHYPYSPERWRIYVDGSKVFPEYNSVAQYNHNVDVHELKPNAGETVAFETAERPRYVVQYEAIASFALSINQKLQSDDKIKFGLFDGVDGWYLEHNATHKEKEVDLVTIRNNNELVREKKTLSKAIFDFTRYELRTNWYNVGRQMWRQSYTKKGDQKNDLIGKTSVDGQRGPQTGNLPLRYEVTAGSGTSNLIFNAGSVGYVILGSPSAIKRIKGIDQTVTTTTADVWEPIAAFRIDPNRKIVSTQITDLEALGYTGSGDVKLIAQSFNKENVGLGTDGWKYHPQITKANNVIQYRNDVTSIVDDTGTSSATVSDPGGYQLGRSILIGTGGGTKTAKNNGNVNIKRELHEDSICVILSYVTATGDITYEITFEQDW